MFDAPARPTDGVGVSPLPSYYAFTHFPIKLKVYE
jgi:hypothetical protein